MIFVQLFIVDKNDIERFHHSRLLREVDLADKVSRNDAGSICWTEFREGGTICSCSQLLRKCLLLSFSKIWHKWGQKERGGSLINFYRSLSPGYSKENLDLSSTEHSDLQYIMFLLVFGEYHWSSVSCFILCSRHLVWVWQHNTSDTRFIERK